MLTNNYYSSSVMVPLVEDFLNLVQGFGNCGFCKSHVTSHALF